MIRKILIYRYRIIEVDRYYVIEIDSVKELATKGD
jgi:hypothetical protein